MAIHCFTTQYSENEINDAIRYGTYIPVPSRCWNNLRMTSSSLRDVIVPLNDRTSFRCRGIKQYQRLQNLLMIEYQMSSEDNVNWDMAKTRFQNFLHRKFNIDATSIIIHGIVSTSDTWCYIIGDTLPLQRARNKHIRQARNNKRDKLASLTLRMLSPFGNIIGLAAVLIRTRCSR